MRMHQPAGARPVALIGVVAFLVLASCVQSETPNNENSGERYPVSITEPDGAVVTLSHKPTAIISLSPTATEMLFAISAGPQVIAVDEDSNYPAKAPRTKLSGFQPNIEAIAGYAPDLVVASEDLGNLVHGMRALNIPVLLEPAAKTLADSYQQILQLGLATQHAGEAHSLVAQMQGEVASFVASVSKPARHLRVYHELDNTYYSVTSATFIGQVYKILGLTNIADAAAGPVPDYPQLSAEYIVSSNPDLIVLADTKCCGQNLDSVASRPGWGVIRAVQGHQVVGVDDDIASRWGPRVIDFMRAVAPHVQALEKAA